MPEVQVGAAEQAQFEQAERWPAGPVVQELAEPAVQVPAELAARVLPVLAEPAVQEPAEPAVQVLAAQVVRQARPDI